MRRKPRVFCKTFLFMQKISVITLLALTALTVSIFFLRIFQNSVVYAKDHCSYYMVCDNHWGDDDGGHFDEDEDADNDEGENDDRAQRRKELSCK